MDFCCASACLAYFSEVIPGDDAHKTYIILKELELLMRFPVPKLWISSGNRVVESSEEANKRYYLSINLTCYLRSLQLVIVMRLRRDKKSKLLLQNDTSKVTTNVLLTDGVWISVFFLRIFILKLRINEIDF